MRRRSVAAIAITAALVIDTAPVSADDCGKTITVRFVPNRNDARVLKLLLRLARIGEPDLVTLAPGEDVEPLLRKRCGFVNDQLLRVLREVNPRVALTELGRERAINLPPCPFWNFSGQEGVPVSVAAGDRLPDALELRVGSASDRLVRDVVRSASAAAKLDDGVAQDNMEVTVEFTTEPVTIRLKPKYAGHPEKVLESLAKDFREFVPKQLKETYFTSACDAKFDLVDQVIAATPQAGEAQCPPQGSASWPFDEAAIERILRENRLRYPDVSRPKATVVIADTGIDRKDSNWLLLRNDGGETGPHARENKDDDNNGYVDDVVGASMNPPPPYPQIEDSYSRREHGTHVASVAQGLLRNDGLRAEVSSRLQLAIARVTATLKGADDPTPTTWYDPSGILRSLTYAAGIEAPILNWSIETATRQKELEAPLRLDTPLLAVVAAGNNYNYLNQDPRYPAYYAKMFPNRVISVAAHDPWGELLPKSSWGNEATDLAAPGCAFLAQGFDGTWDRVEGTSFAAPLVSFAAALLYSEGITRPEDIKRRILAATSADRRLVDKVWSAGRLDLLRALSVYDDIIVVPGDGEDAPEQVLRGLIESPLSWWLCGENIFIDDLVKLTPNLNAGTEPMRVLLLRPGGILTKKDCAPENIPITFRRLKSVNPVEYGPTETWRLAWVTDVVPAYFRPEEPSGD